MDDNSSHQLSKFLVSIDSDFISIKDVINLIHEKIGLDKDISQAYQILQLAIGKSEEKPHIYKKDKFDGWKKGVFTHARLNSFRAKPYVFEDERAFTLNMAITIERDMRFEDDLPF